LADELLAFARERGKPVMIAWLLPKTRGRSLEQLEIELGNL
jgi:hypothetical protein